MLKPKKKLTKRAIRRDPLLDSLEKSRDFFEANKQKIYTYAGALVVIIVLVWGWNNNREGQKREAMLASTRVTTAYTMGVNADVIAELENVLADYGNSESAALSKYYLAETRMDSADYLGAAEIFEELLAGTDQTQLKIGSALKLAALAEIDGDYSRAASLYDQAATMAMPRASSTYKLQSAYSYYHAGDHDRAEQMVDELIDSKLPGKSKESADYLKGLLKGK